MSLSRTASRTAATLLLSLALATPSIAQGGDRTERLLAELADAPGPPGFEEEVRRIVVREVKPYADSVTYDGIGSVIAKQGASGPKIMLDAHMDELGGVVRRVTGTGYLTMQMLGGWLDQALPDQRWIIIGSKGPVHAVTGIRDIHVVPAEERGRVFPRDSLYLDVGAANAAEVAALGIGPGDPVVPDSPFVRLANGRYLGKAWDDRVGIAVVIEAFGRLKASGHPNQLYLAATVQEEVGLRGARTAADLIKPDIGIAIEGGIAGDTPGRNPEETQAAIGAGPGIFLYDSSTIPQPQDGRAGRRYRAACGHPAAARSGPGLWRRQRRDPGDRGRRADGEPGRARTLHPCAYGVIDRKDFDGMVDLVVAMIERMDAATVADLRDFTPR